MSWEATDQARRAAASATLAFDIYLRATAELIWRALTDPAIVPTFRLGLCFDTDWRPGSPLTTRHPVGVGTVVTSVWPRSFAYTWSETGRPEANGGHPSSVAFELARLGEVTRLTTTHSELDLDGAFLRVVQPGWPMILSSLKSLLETGAPLDFSSVG